MKDFNDFLDSSTFERHFFHDQLDSLSKVSPLLTYEQVKSIAAVTQAVCLDLLREYHYWLHNARPYLLKDLSLDPPEEPVKSPPDSEARGTVLPFQPPQKPEG